jgi:hypothetical protein
MLHVVYERLFCHNKRGCNLDHLLVVVTRMVGDLAVGKGDRLR